MVASDDFSTNQSDAASSGEDASMKASTPVYHRHPLSFEDGNLALLAQDRYFIVHQGFLCRHSQVLQTLFTNPTNTRKLLDRPAVEVDEKWADLGCFLSALYDGV